ncbi:DUF4134 family protein [Sphingobacterium composti Ten et al. 2007 non Yoo et al. 2007]|uniref:DUF4134 family protein n=1 Tax=Sphingobacterium composti TaxID=363260 RepID=UPI001356D0B3|nr:DUF4134 family protein [Sphingobacterium composti Ten et al. 2007 non Yoo et al. 2007]
MQKQLCYLLVPISILLTTHSIVAQPAISEFYSASNQIDRYYISLSDLALAIGGICGVLGGLRIYNNWQLGRDRIDVQIAGWFFSCLFLSILSSVLKGLFQ